MIFLIDDKVNRQISYGWNAERFNAYAESIKTISTYQEIIDSELSNIIFSEHNVVLFHESFFDADHNKQLKESIIIRRALEEYSQANKNFLLVIFSGSKNERLLNDNFGNIPVSTLYQNLEIFVENYENGDCNLKYLLYGSNFEIESIYVNKIQHTNDILSLSESIIVSSEKNIFVARNLDNPIPNIFENVDFAILKSESDNYLNEFISKWLTEKTYDKLFIPLCFGSSLSDFNGLRLATHIRCTRNKNQLTEIFIYGNSNWQDLVCNPFFNVIKIKNINYIDSEYNEFKRSVYSNSKKYEKNENHIELRKLKLDVPLNYEDTHSIANEWSIFRWASILDCQEALDKIIFNIENKIYFKYLRTINPINEIKIDIDELRISKANKQINILYIDDDADKGWVDVLCKILADINGFNNIDYLCDELKNKTRDDIVQTCIDKIKKDDIDLVILDYRLHPDDFTGLDHLQITGLRVLNEIKKYNPGIQVVIFSATNKIWNFQAIEEYQADGFILKEQPENSLEENFTITNLLKFKSVLEICTEKTFLKLFYNNYYKIKQHLLPRKNYKTVPNPLPPAFVDEVLKWLELSYQMLNKRLSDSSLSASYLFLFSVLENLSNRIIDIDNPIQSKDDTSRFNYKFRDSGEMLKLFVTDKSSHGFYRKKSLVLSTTIPISWKFKILNTLDYLSKGRISEKSINKLIQKRNEIIHINSTEGTKIKIDKDLVIELNTILYNGLINL